MHHHLSRFFTGLGVAALGLILSSPADPVTVGDPAHPEALPAAIYQAYTQGSRDITIAPGAYDLPTMNHQDTIMLNGWSDATIHAAGAKLTFEELNHRPVHLYHCTNVTWDGGTLLFVRPAFTQGRVTALGQDATGYTADWQIDTGFATDIDPVKATYDVVDQATRVLKVNTGDWSPASATPLGPGAFRLHYPKNGGDRFAVNDWLVCRAPAGNTIIHMDGSENCTIKNVVLQNAGFAAFFETDGKGGNHYLGCQLQPGPRPPGATEDELVGCGADGFHSANTQTGPDIEDCVFTGVFLDDCIAIHGSFSRVTGTEETNIILGDTRLSPKPGDPIRVADMAGYFAVATCTGVGSAGNGKLRVALDPALQAPINHAQDADLHQGTKASDANYCGRGYKILRCRLGDTRSRGILVKADDGLIDGCKIEGCGMSGISIGPEFWWNEAGYCWNVHVTNNTLTNCDKDNDEQASVWIHGDGAIGNRNITIEKNKFETCYGHYMVRSDWTDGVQIDGNEIDQPFTVRLSPPGHAIWLTNSKNITLSGNTVTAPGDYAAETVGMGPGVTAADVKDQ